MSDYMLIARAAAGQSPARLDVEIQNFKRSLKTLSPQVEWQIQFNLGAGKYVEVFSAPSYECAMGVSIAAQQRGLKMEVSTLRNGW